MNAPGSNAAFEAVYRSEHGQLLRYFRRKAGPDAAPDLVQDAFTRLLRSGALERIDNPPAYLATIARNLLVERARRYVRDQDIFFSLDEGRDAPVRPEQTWRIEEMDLRRVARRALLALPSRTRRIFLMHRLQRRTYGDIAEQLGISHKAVQYHMKRALARCRRAVARLE